jgi:hypothetical protein
VLLIWAVVYRYLSFGAHGSGFYLDPLGNPLAFAMAFVQRAPLLLLGQWSPIPAELAGLVSDERAHTLWLISLGLLLVLLFLFFPLVWQDQIARFWSVGMILSLFPIAAVFPANRLLFFVGLGAMGVLAQLLSDLFGQKERVPGSHLWRIPACVLAICLVAVHLILAPLNMPVVAYAAKQFGEPMLTAIGSIPADPQLAQQELILVNPPDYLMFVTNILTVKVLENQPVPKRLRALVAGPVPLTITRVDAHTLRVKLHGKFFSGVLGRLFRGKDQPIVVGQEFSLTGMTAQVIALTPAGEPEEVVYRFAVPLEDSSLRWLRWETNSYIPFIPPPLGQSLQLPAALGPFDLFRK